jgi:hypothetical protein
VDFFQLIIVVAGPVLPGVLALFFVRLLGILILRLVVLLACSIQK